MKAGGVMTRNVVSVDPDTPILTAAQLMLQNRISGLPAIDRNGKLVGVVTEGDFLRRSETGTERKRPRWLEFLTSPGKLANEYVHSHGRKVEEVMTPTPISITEDTELDEVVSLMEKRRIKRLPVVREGRVVGIITRANLLYTLASIVRQTRPATEADAVIKKAVLAELEKQPWAPRDLIDVTVLSGAVDLWGVVLADPQREAATVVAENVRGVKTVRNHIALVEPMSGMVIYNPDELIEPKNDAS